MKCSLSLIQPLFLKRATLAEKEVTALKEQLAGANQSSVSADMAQPPNSEQIQRSSLEIELSSKDKEITQLLEDVQRLQSSFGKLQESSAKQIGRLQEELDNKKQHILRLEAKLDAQKDYNDLKRQLNSLKSNEECKQEDSEKKEITKSESPTSTPSQIQGDVGPLHNVETFGSLLGEEIVANWRRSLERTIVSQTTRPTPPPYPSWSEETGKVKSESVEREGRSVSPGVEDLANGEESPGEPTDSETNNNNNTSTTSNNNLPNGLCPGGTFGVGINNNLLGSGGSLADAIKSPFRFDERSPFRYGDDPGCMVGRFGESLIPKGDPMEARLQEMLRYNMDKYANQNLDTLHIARRVRELLSIHNVGQRLFAKYVLGLSQGTVSELLSKPKPWDKLTEKGRDSYRKMHAWACDENAVLLLKSLIPKKGKDPSVGNVMGGRPENDITEERIAHILNEASNYIKPPGKGESPSNEDSQSPNHPQSAESPSGRDSLLSRRIKKYENDDISQEQVVRIYHEELVKLMGRRLEDQPFHGLMFPHFLGASASSGEDVRLAMDAYHRELAKMNPTGSLPFPLAAMHQQVLSSHNGIAQDLSMPKQDRKEKSVNGDEKKDDERHASAFSLVRPKVEPSSPLGNVILPPEDIGSTAAASTAAVSPLQRMASITNSLISQPPAQHHHTPSQRPLKAVLPPITQQQFDQFNNLNTEEIVRKVKEQLSQFSISQRLFGESVLGLSQGSVSDLLARPKPWHMLTQKGREPFIRMKMFLEDSNAVHKLVASQYKIAPEKLMRTGGYGVNSSPHSKAVTSNCGKYGSGMMHSAQNMHISHPNPAPPPVPPLTPPDLKKCSIPPQHNQQIPMQQFPPMKNIQHPAAPSVYEMAALTQELDTQGITTKIKEALLANNIGQKIFGEAVLGLSQGSVSELLSKPKPWHMLSIKGREPFIRMQLWLSDSQNIDRLQAIKTAKRELNKRRRGSGQQDNSSDTSSNDTSEFYQSSANSPPSSKKQRVLFSEEQKEALKIAFALDPYPNVATIEFLANDLNLVSRAISNWFHNHRMRLKQIPQGESSLNREGQGCGFDPVKFRMLLSQRLGIQAPFSSASQYFPPYSADSGNLSNLSSLSQEQREEVSGLDLTVKHDDDFEDNESHLDSEDSYSGIPETRPPEPRSSRRKPAAPQWVNPDWQQESEVIINGVCVMQTEDFEREGREETVRVEPTPVPEEHCGSPEPTNEAPSDESKVVVKQESKEDKWDNPF